MCDLRSAKWENWSHKAVEVTASTDGVGWEGGWGGWQDWWRQGPHFPQAVMLWMTKYWLVHQIFFFFAAVTLPTATGGGKIPRSQKGKVFPWHLIILKSLPNNLSKFIPKTNQTRIKLLLKRVQQVFRCVCSAIYWSFLWMIKCKVKVNGWTLLSLFYNIFNKRLRHHIQKYNINNIIINNH